MNRFTISETPFAGLKVIERLPQGDSRGFFERIFCANELNNAGWGDPIVQINHSYTREIGTVRGLHYQNPPYTEMKMVSCLKGKIWDVVVDFRAGSETFLQWFAIELSDDNFKAFLIPRGFAHGFQTLTSDCELLYLHTQSYVPDAESGLHPQDPRLKIKWPLTITDLSARDRQHLFLTKSPIGLQL